MVVLDIPSIIFQNICIADLCITHIGFLRRIDVKYTQERARRILGSTTRIHASCWDHMRACTMTFRLNTRRALA